MPEIVHAYVELFGWLILAWWSGVLLLGFLRGTVRSLRELRRERARQREARDHERLVTRLATRLAMNEPQQHRPGRNIARVSFAREATYGTTPPPRALTPEEVNRILTSPAVEDESQ